MKILILSNEVWNDKINGNNILSNWFEGMDAEFANIYCEPNEPYNKCCKKYFQITDMMMLKSIFGKEKAGKIIFFSDIYENQINYSGAEEEPKKLYTFLKSISGSWLRFIRELLWLAGKYNKEELKKFIDNFQPDIIFTERMASCKMLRLEKLISEISTKPIIAFTGDDEYSFKQLSFSPFFWINRIMVRKQLRKMVQKYKIYYTLSLEQKKDYEKLFGCQMKILQKGGTFPDKYKRRKVHKPIRMIYAGKLYCNRWKVLAQIVRAIQIVNKEAIHVILEIYTKEVPTKRQKRLLNDEVNSKIMGAVTQNKLKEIYQNSDIALHVESQDLKNRLATRLSFSTKIIDCMESGCAIMAVCWKNHSGYLYLKREKAALCINSFKDIVDTLNRIVDKPNIINEYAEAAYNCGKNNHEKTKVQSQLLSDFYSVKDAID